MPTPQKNQLDPNPFIAPTSQQSSSSKKIDLLEIQRQMILIQQSNLLGKNPELVDGYEEEQNNGISV